MPKNKKKFISKKNSVTFHLVHRSQQDPLAADENAPQHVLLQQQSGRKKNKEEEHKYGIFQDDEYDYMQHLKNISDAEVSWERVDPKINIRVKNADAKPPTKLQLPSSVFASSVEEPVGLLNKAAPIHGPRLDLDPDIVAAMDEDFQFDDPDNMLEDNFIELANQPGSDEESDGSFDEEGSDIAEEAEDEVHSLCDEFGEVETRSRFTDYSMSSSVMRRNEQLSLLDSRFEKMFETTYEECDIGALECEEIEGTVKVQDSMLLNLAEEYAKEKQREELVRERTLATQAGLYSDEEEEELRKVVVKEDSEKWDCETILSTYSNLYNHPAKICEPKGPSKIRISKKTGMPMNELTGRSGPKLTAHALAQHDGDTTQQHNAKSIISMVSELSHRPKDETTEERRQRKHKVKEYRRERRSERKANTEAFKEETVRQEKVMLNLRNNLRGVKIL